MRKTMVLAGVVLVLVSVGVASADMINMVMLRDFGVKSHFDGTNHVLTFDQGRNGTIVMDNGTAIPFSTSAVQMTFNGMADSSSGGVAKASSTAGTWSISLFDSPSVEILEMSGTMQWFIDEETIEISGSHSMAGKGHLYLNTCNVNESWFAGKGFQDGVLWPSPDGELGLKTTAYGLSPNDPSTYSEYVSSNNVVVTLYADSSQVVPEPATVGLLLAGVGLFLVRRRTRRAA